MTDRRYARAGLRHGDLLVRINGESVGSLAGPSDAVSHARGGAPRGVVRRDAAREPAGTNRQYEEISICSYDYY